MPAELNNLSQGTDDAGTQKLANLGKRCSFVFHHISGFSPSGSLFSALKRPNSSCVVSAGSSVSESESINLQRLFIGSETTSCSMWLTEAEPASGYVK